MMKGFLVRPADDRAEARWAQRWSIHPAQRIDFYEFFSFPRHVHAFVIRPTLSQKEKCYDKWDSHADQKTECSERLGQLRAEERQHGKNGNENHRQPCQTDKPLRARQILANIAAKAKRDRTNFHSINLSLFLPFFNPSSFFPLF